MINFLKSAITFICLLFLNGLSAQDIHFSQYNLAPIHVNPALSGSLDAKARIIAGYRNQWSASLRGDAYNQYTLSGDSRINLAKGSYLGFGFTGHRDVAGELNFGTTQGSLSVSYGKCLLKNEKAAHYLIGGAQFGIAQRRVDVTNARWPSQHDGNGGFDPNEPAPDLPGFSPDFLHADVNVGLSWRSSFENGLQFYLGTAMHHVNKPNVSFYGNTTTETLAIRTTIHGGADIPVFANFSLVPTFLYMTQGPHKEFTSGSYLKFTTANKNTFLQGGMLVRVGNDVSGGTHTDAIILAAAASINGIMIGVGLDLTVSELREPGGNGAFEVSLGYVLGRRAPLQTVLW